VNSASDLLQTRVRIPEVIRALQTPLLVAVAYYLGAQAAFLVGTLSDRIFAPFWPPNVILFCTLLLVPTRSWWLYILAIFPAHTLAEMSVGMPMGQLLVAFATNCVVAILNAIGVRSLLAGPPWFGTLSNAAMYVLLTAMVNPAISAFGGAFVQVLGAGTMDQYWWFWGYWFASNAFGCVTLGAAFLVWFSQRSGAGPLTRRRRIEAIALGVGLVAVCGFAFGAGVGTVNRGFLPALLYSPLPFILWAAIRFGEKGATGAILVVTVVSISESLNGSGLFIAPDAERNVLALQIFLMGISIPVFLLGAAIDELHGATERMRHMAGTLLRAQDEERRRIARELHDSTGQNLVVACLMAEKVQGMAPPSCGPAIIELNEILQRSILEVRTFSYLLHPPFLDETGLSFALRSYLSGFTKRTGLKVDLDVPPDLGRLPGDVELVLFRVIQEALTNVWRHSGSASAEIRLLHHISHGTRRVILMIEDTGKGFPDSVLMPTLARGRTKDHVTSGLGISGMRERLRQIGGHLEIESVSGKTTIRVTVVVDDEFQSRSPHKREE
jgi:signal transduction histidine kinase